jgi:hypothetical protein
VIVERAAYRLEDMVGLNDMLDLTGEGLDDDYAAVRRDWERAA